MEVSYKSNHRIMWRKNKKQTKEEQIVWVSDHPALNNLVQKLDFSSYCTSAKWIIIVRIWRNWWLNFFLPSFHMDSSPIWRFNWNLSAVFFFFLVFILCVLDTLTPTKSNSNRVTRLLGENSPYTVFSISKVQTQNFVNRTPNSFRLDQQILVLQCCFEPLYK